MTLARSAFIVLNGKTAGREDVRAAVGAARGDGLKIEVGVTWEGSDAERFARRAAKEGFEVVVAAGGDGTVNGVGAGLLAPSDRKPPRLAIMPLGTANDLARACGIPLDPSKALSLAVSGPGASVDVGLVDERPFLNVATGGFGASLTTATPPELKRLLGGAAYLLTGLTHFNSIRPSRGRLRGPGFGWEGEFLVLAVGNGRQAGGGHPLCPEAMLNDGLLDVRVLPKLPNDELPHALHALLRHGLDAIQHRVAGARLSQLEVETEETLQINLDGEPVSGTRFRFELLPSRLTMALPPECALLA